MQALFLNFFIFLLSPAFKRFPATFKVSKMSKSTKNIGVALPPELHPILQQVKEELGANSLSDLCRKIILTFLLTRGYKIPPEMFAVSPSQRTDLRDPKNLARLSAYGKKAVFNARKVMLKNRERRRPEKQAAQLKITRVSDAPKQGRRKNVA